MSLGKLMIVYGTHLEDVQERQSEKRVLEVLKQGGFEKDETIQLPNIEVYRGKASATDKQTHLLF